MPRSAASPRDVTVDRVTLIYDDNSTQVVYGGTIVKKSPTQLHIKAPFVPREHIGMDVVAAHDDGTVEESFTVEDMWMDSGYRVYEASCS